MNIPEYFGLLINDYTVRTISMGTAIMGIICGILGTFAVLRRQSLLGDAISHASLPGIAIAFILTGSKEPLVLFTGAIISGLAGTLLITAITSKTHLKQDTALGIVLSVFFGFGMLLLTMIQKQANANQAGLDKFLFGQAATLMVSDVYLLAIAGGVAFVIVLLLRKEFKILAFDPQFAKTLGFNIVIAGYSAHLTDCYCYSTWTPDRRRGADERYAAGTGSSGKAMDRQAWDHDRCWRPFLDVVSGVTGTAISASLSKISTGPVIVLIAFALVMISFVFAPNRGLLFRVIRQWKNRKNLKHELSTI